MYLWYFFIEGSPADAANLQIGHRILRINGQDVSRATSDTVARIIRFCSAELNMEVHKCQAEVCMFEEMGKKTGDAESDSSDSTSWPPLLPPRNATSSAMLSHACTSRNNSRSALLSDADYSEDDTLS